MSDPHEFGLPARHDEDLGRFEAGLAQFVATVRRLRETARPIFADSEESA